MIAQSAGDRVSALIAEITIDTETATANCWKSCPDMPGMNATGTKTERSTSVVAMIAPVISDMAADDASAADIPGFSSILVSTASTTTIGSSTTIPMASTIASNDTVLSENPMACKTTKVPTSATGTAMSGTIVARSEPRNRNTTNTTRMKASISVVRTSCMLSFTKVELSETTSWAIPSGKSAAAVSITALTASAAAMALPPGAR